MSTLPVTRKPFAELRPVTVVVAVTLIHAMLLWPLYTRPVSQSVEPRVTPVELLLLSPGTQPDPDASTTDVATHRPPPAPSQSSARDTAVPRSAPLHPPRATAPPEPQGEPASAADPSPTVSTQASAPAVSVSPARAATEPVPDPAESGHASLPPPSPPVIEMPSAAATYLNNPKPRYPSVSRRLGEQGEVVLRVRIEADGTASQAEVVASSGHARLDNAALQTVLGWRFVPGSRNGQPEPMWFNVPIQFVLE